MVSHTVPCAIFHGSGDQPDNKKPAAWRVFLHCGLCCDITNRINTIAQNRLNFNPEMMVVV